MSLQSCLLCDTVQVNTHDTMLILNSASDPFVQQIAQSGNVAKLLLAEDNIATIKIVEHSLQNKQTAFQHIAFHNSILHYQSGGADVAVMNLLYQPGTAWIIHGLQLAFHILRSGGRLYVTGTKERGILSTARRIQAIFGNAETLLISKGQRVICSQKLTEQPLEEPMQDVSVFASSKLDEGTRLLISAVEVHAVDEALDIGCGAGFLGLHIARQATQGFVTMVDVSLAAVAAAQKAVEQSELQNIRVLASDGSEAVSQQRFDLVVTNPPFHMGGIQTLDIAERFIREAAQILRPRGRFYLVANRFLKYESVLHTHFKYVEEVGGDTRYKVLRALLR